MTFYEQIQSDVIFLNYKSLNPLSPVTSSIRISHLWFYSAFRLIRSLILRITPVCNVSCEHITVMADLSVHSDFILLNVIFIDAAVDSLCLY